VHSTAVVCVGEQLVESEMSAEHSGFANPLYNRDDATSSATSAPETTSVVTGRDGRPPSVTVKAGFKPATDDSGNDTLQLVVQDVDD